MKVHADPSSKSTSTSTATSISISTSISMAASIRYLCLQIPKLVAHLEGPDHASCGEHGPIRRREDLATVDARRQRIRSKQSTNDCFCNFWALSCGE